ncbi:MAG TPA: DUF2267 domain-containing protein [Caulobacterales bacterium]|nr:DUF2267 domain-containing protein [Caulobacterales bacterium]
MTTGLAVFDTTVQDSNLWLKDVAGQLGGCERQEAYAALRAVLHALRDRLQPQAAVNFAAQLPMLLRGVYFEGWTMPDAPSRTRSVQDFADAIAASLPPRFQYDPLLCARAVFATAARYLSDGEADKVMSQLPQYLRELWPHVEIV